MPSARDYLIATLMGEANREGAVAQQGILDVIANRALAPSQYGSRSSNISDIVTARNGLEFNAWMPSDANYDRTTRALAGPGLMRGPEINQYENAARVVDDFMTNGIGRGSSQGATFYQTPGAPNQYQIRAYWGPNRDNYLAMGGHNFSGPGFTRDAAAYQAANPQYFNGQYKYLPPAGSDLVGDGFDASQGAGVVGPGGVSNLGQPYETGDRFGFTGADASYGVGPGFNGLGGAVPYGDVDPYAFAGGSNVGGGDPGSFGGFTGTMETGGGRGFTGMNAGGGVGLGSFGSGVTQPGPAPDPYGFTGMNPSQGVGPGTLGQLPAGFDPAAYLAANRDVAAAGIDPRQHYLSFGAAEGRALGPAGFTPTQGPSGTTPTHGPDGSVSVTSQGLIPTGTTGFPDPAGTYPAPQAVNGLPPGFDARTYLAINPDVAASGIDPGTHYRLFGAQEGRSYGAPGLSPTLGPPASSPTIGPDGSVSVVSTGLVPTQGPPANTPTQGPGPTITAQTGTFNPAEYLAANSDVAASGQDPLSHFLNYGVREGRAIDTLGNHFNGQAYLAANRDVAMAGMDPVDHFLRYGAQEARTLAPTDWTSPLTATTSVGTIGAPAATPTIGPGGMTPTIGAPSPTPTYGAPATTPTIGAGSTVPSWSPFGGAGIGNRFGFTGLNAGTGLGATNQSFGSLWPAGDSPASAPEQPAAGPSVTDPWGFTDLNVSGFDPNAGGATGPNSVNEMGASGGFDSEGAMRRVLEQQAADIRRADQAAKTPMHSDPNAFNTALANGGSTVGMGTPLQTPGAVGAPVAPNLTVSNLALGAPGAMFGAFARW